MTRIVPAGAGDHGREVRAAVLVYQGGVALVTVPDLQQHGNTLTFNDDNGAPPV